jgi:hypothetical protein
LIFFLKKLHAISFECGMRCKGFLGFFLLLKMTIADMLSPTILEKQMHQLIMSVW